MAPEVKSRIEQRVEELKKEIFAELDQLSSSVAEDVAGQVTEQIEEYLEDQVESEVAWHMEIERKERIKKRIHDNFIGFQTKLQSYRTMYALLVASGFMLFWFGAWQLLGQLTIFADGVLPLFLGLLLLFITGTVYQKLIG